MGSAPPDLAPLPQGVAPAWPLCARFSDESPVSPRSSDLLMFIDLVMAYSGIST